MAGTGAKTGCLGGGLAGRGGSVEGCLAPSTAHSTASPPRVRTPPPGGEAQGARSRAQGGAE
eukprot:2032239-Rhodomonas_salina.2